MYTKFKTFLKKRRITYYLTSPIYKLYRWIVMMLAHAIKGLDDNKVVFSSFFSYKYSDNPRYISEKLHEMRPETDIVWLFSKMVIDNIQVPDYVRKVQPISIKGLIEQATARVWVDNVKKSDALSVVPGQYYINTWHGDRGFKRVGVDNDKRIIKKKSRIEKNCSLMIAGSRFGEGTFRTAFNYKGQVLNVGCPRNDILINGDDAVAERVRKAFGIPDGVKVLMYAPTYRDKQKNNQACPLDLDRALDCFEETTGCKWVCLYRAHYLCSKLDIKNGDRIIDATSWPEMAELLLISDAIISDYSSCTCDFTLTRRPAFLYISDIDEYLEDSREFYFDLYKSPFLLARNMDELEELIKNTDAERARKTAEALDEFYGTTETGHASRSVCEYIIDKLA